MSKPLGRPDKDYKFNTRFALLCGERYPDRSLDAWGEIFNVSRQTISYWMGGHSVPDIIKLTKVAQYFNVSADFLLGLSDVESPDANARSAVEYTGLTEAAVEQLHIGIDTSECEGVGASESEKRKNVAIASELICSGYFEKMIVHIVRFSEAVYTEELLKLVSDEFMNDANNAEEEQFVFKHQSDRDAVIKFLDHIARFNGIRIDKNGEKANLEILSGESDNELANDIFYGILNNHDTNEVHQFHAAKAFNYYIDKIVEARKTSAQQQFEKLK